MSRLTMYPDTTPDPRVCVDCGECIYPDDDTNFTDDGVVCNSCYFKRELLAEEDEAEEARMREESEVDE